MKNLCISTNKISNIKSLVNKPFYYRILTKLFKKFVIERIFNELAQDLLVEFEPHADVKPAAREAVARRVRVFAAAEIVSGPDPEISLCCNSWSDLAVPA